MRVTVCQLSNKEKRFKRDWERLTQHTSKKKSDLVLLPELPFSSWIATSKDVDDDLKAEIVGKHESWIKRIPELNASIVVYTKPVLHKGKFYNTAFVWTKKNGHKKVRTKYYLPEEEHFYEESWFDRGERLMDLVETKGIKLGILICSELWFLEHARKLGKKGMDILLVPRATGASSVKKWLNCGKIAAISSGAFCLSSNRSGEGNKNFQWGGTGWVIRPKDGKILRQTNRKEPFRTVEIDLDLVKKAKKSYPLYIKE